MGFGVSTTINGKNYYDNIEGIPHTERFESVKNNIHKILSIWITAINGHHEIINRSEWSEKSKRLIHEINDTLESKLNYLDLSFLLLMENKILENSELLDSYFKLFSSEKIKSNKVDSYELFPNKDESLEMSNKLVEFEFNLESIKSILASYSILKENYDKVVHGFIHNATIQTEAELRSFRKLRSIADNALTEDFYGKAVEKYHKLEFNYRIMFYCGIGITLFFSTLLFCLKNSVVPHYLSNTEFWVVKLSIIAVGITLISYFLKQSSHYQRLADQNYQTQIELQAYPSFMESIPTEEAASVRKELALKYFGREIDGTAHKDMSNLISDQMKSTTDMVKATTEAIKNLKGS